VDEVSLDLEPPLHACWMKQGQQKIVPALQPGSKKHRHIFGAYSWNTDRISWQVSDWKNSKSFLDFIEYLLVECYPTGRVVLVMDNVSYHKSAAVLAASLLSGVEPDRTILETLETIGLPEQTSQLHRRSGRFG
jgi:DDE superfamily endonuclease